MRHVFHMLQWAYTLIKQTTHIRNQIIKQHISSGKCSASKTLLPNINVFFRSWLYKIKTSNGFLKREIHWPYFSSTNFWYEIFLIFNEGVLGRCTFHCCLLTSLSSSDHYPILWTYFNAIWSNIDEVLSINQSIC